MNRESYDKRLVRQKIQAHRDIARLELETLKTQNPLTSAFNLGHSVQSLFGGSGGRTTARATAIAAIPVLVFAAIKLWRRLSTPQD